MKAKSLSRAQNGYNTKNQPRSKLVSKKNNPIARTTKNHPEHLFQKHSDYLKEVRLGNRTYLRRVIEFRCECGEADFFYREVVNSELFTVSYTVPVKK